MMENIFIKEAKFANVYFRRQISYFLFHYITKDVINVWEVV